MNFVWPEIHGPWIFDENMQSMPDNPGLVDFAIGLVNSVFNLPGRQVIIFEESE